MQSRISSRNLAPIVLVCLCSMQLMTACGRASQSSTTSTPTQSTPSPTARVTQSATATTVSQGKVVVSASQANYRSDNTITITIANGLSQSIFVTPYHTSCTPIELEKEVQSNWVVLGNCVRGQMPRPVAIKAGTTVQLQISPNLNTLRSNASALWQAGTYRASLTYNTTSPDPDVYNPPGTVTQSATFTVS